MTIPVQITDAGRTAEGYGFEHNDCVVRACTIITGRPYAEIHAAFKAQGRRARCGTKFRMIEPVINRPLVVVPNRPTVAYFLATHPQGTYGVAIAGHVFAVIDGKILDLFQPGMRCRVKYIWAM